MVAPPHCSDPARTYASPRRHDIDIQILEGRQRFDQIDADSLHAAVRSSRIVGKRCDKGDFQHAPLGSVCRATLPPLRGTLFESSHGHIQPRGSPHSTSVRLATRPAIVPADPASRESRPPVPRRSCPPCPGPSRRSGYPDRPSRRWERPSSRPPETCSGNPSKSDVQHRTLAWLIEIRNAISREPDHGRSRWEGSLPVPHTAGVLRHHPRAQQNQCADSGQASARSNSRSGRFTSHILPIQSTRCEPLRSVLAFDVFILEGPGHGIGMITESRPKPLREHLLLFVGLHNDRSACIRPYRYRTRSRICVHLWQPQHRSPDRSPQNRRTCDRAAGTTAPPGRSRTPRSSDSTHPHPPVSSPHSDCSIGARRNADPEGRHLGGTS